MNKLALLKYVTLIAKIAGVLAGLNTIPFIPAEWGLTIFVLASIVKDAANRLGDYLDDGQINQSLKD